MAMFVRLVDDYGQSINTFQKGFFRNAIAFAVALPVFLKHIKNRPKKTIIPKQSWRVLWLRSILGTIGIFANFYALSHISIAEGQTLNKTAPFFTVVFAWLFLGEHFTKRQFFILLIAFTGVIFIAKPGFAGQASFPLCMGLLGGIAAGAAYTCVRKLGLNGVSGPAIVLFFSAFSCLAAIPFTILNFTPMTLPQAAIMLGTGITAAIGQFGITAAYKFAAPRQIAVFDYTNIVFTAILGFALFGQIPDALSFAGMALIILAAISRR